MSLEQHAHDTAIGVIGTSVAGSFTFMGFISGSVPVMQFISLCVGIAVGIVTFLYYLRKLEAEKVEAAAVVAADVVKAEAVVVAAAVAAHDDLQS